MKIITRERIALLMFFSLLSLSLVSFVVYLNVGHNWNVAATAINDASGEMEGYTVILYEGVYNPEIKHESEILPSSINETSNESSNALNHSESSESSENEASNTSSGAFVYPINPEVQEKFKEIYAGSNLGFSKNENEQSFINSLRKDLLLGKNYKYSEPSQFEKTVDTIDPLKKKTWVSLQAVRADYVKKGACVLTLDVQNPQQYDYGMIVRCGGRSYGILYVDSLVKKDIEIYQKYIKRLKDNDVDFVVLIVPEMKYVRNLMGESMVISLNDDGLFSMGETHHGVFCVDSAERGKATAIFVSPQSVLSAKDILKNPV